MSAVLEQPLCCFPPDNDVPPLVLDYLGGSPGGVLCTWSSSTAIFAQPSGNRRRLVFGWLEGAVNVVNRLGGVGGVVSCLPLGYSTRLCQELLTGVRLAYHRTQNVDLSEAGFAIG